MLNASHAAPGFENESFYVDLRYSNALHTDIFRRCPYPSIVVFALQDQDVFMAQNALAHELGCLDQSRNSSANDDAGLPFVRDVHGLYRCSSHAKLSGSW